MKKLKMKLRKMIMQLLKISDEPKVIVENSDFYYLFTDEEVKKIDYLVKERNKHIKIADRLSDEIDMIKYNAKEKEL
ncbi:MAG: hypothetical protein EOM50_13940 [Erysipelotrichia bacterium]|nr:hypothetical protein [Erysipelotrichia bacterium]